MNNWTINDIDQLIEEVNEIVTKADSLSKSSLKKDDMPPQDDQTQDPSMEAAPAQPEQPPVDPQQDVQPDQQANPEADAQADQQLEGEQQDTPLTDEELSQIYGSMDQMELERHYSVIRQSLQAAYGSGEQEEQPGQPEENESQPDQDDQIPPQPGQPAPEKQAATGEQIPDQENQEMEKSEKISALEKQVQEQAVALAQITKAFEVLAKPARKSVTDMNFIAKSELSGSNKPMSTDEVKEKAKKLRPDALTKSERDQVTTFFLYGEGQKEIEKLINSKGVQ